MLLQCERSSWSCYLLIHTDNCCNWLVIMQVHHQPRDCTVSNLEDHADTELISWSAWSTQTIHAIWISWSLAYTFVSTDNLWPRLWYRHRTSIELVLTLIALFVSCRSWVTGSVCCKRLVHAEYRLNFLERDGPNKTAFLQTLTIPVHTQIPWCLHCEHLYQCYEL